MNPDHIQDIITALKEDKSCVQPWRNKAVARLEEAIAFVYMGHRTVSTSAPVCTCPAYPSAVDKACPVHGS